MLGEAVEAAACRWIIYDRPKLHTAHKIQNIQYNGAGKAGQKLEDSFIIHNITTYCMKWKMVTIYITITIKNMQLLHFFTKQELFLISFTFHNEIMHYIYKFNYNAYASNKVSGHYNLLSR